eukprot:TRINITY_DN68124_c0_g1_i1.p1 TRINITY_DN68124_c0_g1~~TRINITY_DN68124_c0_g1_i1.p1  ORF type:complete len:282 (+),score=58.00 TRINITY_DN68124_c0_g1_i1:72-917(+)
MGNAVGACCEKKPSLQVQELGDQATVPVVNAKQPQTAVEARKEHAAPEADGTRLANKSTTLRDEERAKTPVAGVTFATDSGAQHDEAVLCPEPASARAVQSSVQQVEQPGGKGAAVDAALLQGSWLETIDGELKPICTILDGSIFWDEEMNTLINLQNGKIAIQLDGQEITAVFDEGPPASLVWSDGATWVRDDLQGRWMSQNDGEEVCQIWGNYIHWDAKFGQSPCEFQPSKGILPFGSVSMELFGEKHTGLFDPGPPARISWSDGELWYRTTTELPSSK